MEVLNKPLHDKFYECVRGSYKSIKLCSPFVKSQTIERLYSEKQAQSQVKLVTNMNLMNFYKKASDISALKSICMNNGQIHNFQRLHAKIYIFDDATSIITSANLTLSGLHRNYEYGVFIDERNIVEGICNDFDLICADESVSKINIGLINDIEDILLNLPKPN